MSTEQRPPRTDDETYSQAELSWLAAFGMALRLSRVRLGWSQSELAERAGTRGRTVSCAEQGFQASLPVYRRLAETMGLPLVEILEKAETLVAKGVPGTQVIEVPAGSPVMDQLVIAATGGTVTYLTQEGRRVAAVVPADLAEPHRDQVPAV
jgi:transcriptional regulator with XRE-family HTH domain